MKNLNVKAALVLSLLAFSACDKGGGGSSTPQVVSVPGVTLRQYNVAAGQSCNINGDNTYTCTENGSTKGAIGYSSLQTFCANISNDSLNGFVARYTRQIMFQEQCSGAQNNGHCAIGTVLQNGLCVPNNGTTLPGTNPGTIITQPGMKNVTCQLYVKKGATEGDTGQMNVQVIENSKTGVNIFALTNHHIQKKFLGIFNFNANKFSNSEKLAKVKMYYTKESGKAEMIKLEAIGVDDQLGASVTGFAGSEVRLKIAPQDDYSDATRLEIVCKAEGATTGNALAYKGYRCLGEEKDGNKVTKIEGAELYNEDIMGKRFPLTKSVTLETEGALATGSGAAKFEQIARWGIDSSVSTISNITTPSVVTVARPNYRLKVECGPVQ